MTSHLCKTVVMLFTEFNMDEAIEVWMEEGFEKGLEKGREEGREEARKEAQREFARKLKALAIIPIEQIAQITGLTVAEIEEH